MPNPGVVFAQLVLLMVIKPAANRMQTNDCRDFGVMAKEARRGDLGSWRQEPGGKLASY